MDHGCLPLVSRRALAIILLAALSLRLVGGAVVQRQVREAGGPPARYRFPDSQQFHALARSLLDRGAYLDAGNRQAWRTPVFSLLLAGLYAALGDDPRWARVLNNLIDVFNVWLVFLLASRMFSRRAGLIAAGIAAFYPFFIYFSNLVLADTLGVTAVLLVTLAFHSLQAGARGVDSHGGIEAGQGGAAELLRLCASGGGHSVSSLIFRAGLAGLALAFAVMVKAAFALLGVFFAAFLLAAAASRRRIFLALAAIALAFVAGMAPWWIRNYRVFGGFVPFSTMGGFTLYESNSEFADGGPNDDKIRFPFIWELLMTSLANMEGEEIGELSALPLRERAQLRRLHGLVLEARSPEDLCPLGLTLLLDSRGAAGIELLADQKLQREVLSWIRANPGRFLCLMPVKILRTWNVWPNWEGASSWKYKAMSLATYAPVMLLGLLGLVAYRRRWREVYLLVIPALYITCLHAVFMGSIRYRLPAMGGLIVLAAGGIEIVVRKIQMRNEEREANSSFSILD